MYIRIKHYLKFFFLFCVLFVEAKSIDIPSLENEILQYNREGKQVMSEKRLSGILLQKILSNEEKANVYYLLANTYRSANDYLTCIDYLNKASEIASKLPQENIIRTKIDYEYAFVYFDNNDFKKCKIAMANIAKKNYKNAFPEDKAYILMQEGVILIKEKKIREAKIKYDSAYVLMKKNNPCNLPIVLVKYMRLFSLENNISKSEDYYKESMRIAEKCNILKYKTFATAEMERIYKEKNLLSKALIFGEKTDSLRNIEKLDKTISELHIMEKKRIEIEKEQERNLFYIKKIILFLVIVLLVIMSLAVYFRNKKRHKNEKNKMETEMAQMRKELKEFSKNKFLLDDKDENKQFPAFDSEKLTDRQKELLKLMANGFSNKEIAEKLFISESTVKYHIKNIYNILELKNRKDFFTKIIKS